MVTTSEDQSVPANEPPSEVQRNLPQIVSDLAMKAAEGSVSGAAAYGVKKVLDKTFGRRPEPPKAEPSANQGDAE